MKEEFISRFQEWWREAKADPTLRHKGAVCVSTIDEAGFPNARFVDLKAATEDGFSFCTYLDSKKGLEIDRHPKVALTLWWENVGYQVRVQGHATRIDRTTAGEYWRSRSRDAQLTTLCSRQSEPLVSNQQLLDQLATLHASIGEADVPMPDNWGGYIVDPVSVEFLTFKDDRLHERERYSVAQGQWRLQFLQP